MCTGAVRFYSENHHYECNSERYTSVSQLIGLFENKFDEDAESWAMAVKIYHIGDFWDTKKQRMYLEDETVKAHYPIALWEDQKQGIARRFRVKGTLQKQYLYNYVNGVKDEIRVELAILKAKVLAKWKNTNKVASEGGTKYHDQQERKTIFEKYGVTMEEFKKEETEKGYKEAFSDIYTQVRDGDEPELFVYDHEYKVAGQMDRPHFRTKGQSRYVKIFDYKTNFDGIPKTNSFGHNFAEPINDLPECKYFHYALQQSTYGYLLERKGFIYEGGVLEWRKIDFETGEELDREDIEVPYLREHVIRMLDYLKHRNTTNKKKVSVWDKI